MEVVSDSGHKVDIAFDMRRDRVFKILTESIYSFPEIAAVREQVRNSVDAVKARGSGWENGEIVIAVDQDDCTISVEDNGVGETYECIRDVYCRLGETSKGLDSAFGIGSKAAFLLASSFTVQTWAENHEPLTFVVSLDGVSFIHEDKMPPLSHVGTRVTIPFDPEKVDLKYLLDMMRDTFRYLSVPTYLNLGGKKERLNNGLPLEDLTNGEINVKNMEVMTEAEYRERYSASSLRDGSVVKWECDSWMVLAWMPSKPRGMYGSCNVRLYVDDMPVTFSDGPMNGGESAFFMPFCNRVVVDIKDRRLVDVTPDRERIIDSEKTRNMFKVIQRETEEQLVAKILDVPMDPSLLPLWKNLGVEPVWVLLRELLSGITHEYHKDKRNHIASITGWGQKALTIAHSLVCELVEVYIGKGKSVMSTKTLDQPVELLQALYKAKLLGWSAYVAESPKHRRTLPKGTVLLIPSRRGRERRMETVELLMNLNLGAKPLEQLPEDTEELVTIWRNKCDYERSRIQKTTEDVPLNKVGRVIAVEATDSVRALIAADRLWWSGDRFTHMKRSQLSFARRKATPYLKGVQFLKESGRKIRTRFHDQVLSLEEACNKWMRQRRQKRRVLEALFPVPEKTRNFMPTRVRFLHGKRPRVHDEVRTHSRRMELEFVFIDNEKDMPRALQYVATVVYRAKGIMFTARFIEELLLSIVRSEKVSSLLRRYHKTRLYRSYWGGYRDVFTSYHLVSFSDCYRRIRGKDKCVREKWCIRFSYVLPKCGRLFFDVLGLLLAKKHRTRSLAFDLFRSMRVEWWTDHVVRILRIARDIQLHTS